ncbi:MAG: IS607 family transposase [Ferroplasma sp.]
MKANEVMNLLRISRKTLHVYIYNGKLRHTVNPNGYYDYNDEDVYKLLNKSVKRKTVLYARVSTPKQKKDLENQIEQLKQWCFMNGYTINSIYSDIAPGTSFGKRKGFFEMLDEILDYRIDRIILTYKDRLSRTGFDLFKHLFEKFGTEIVVISDIGNAKLDSEEVFEDIASMLHFYSMKMYSKRSKHSMEVGYESDKD